MKYVSGVLAMNESTIYRKVPVGSYRSRYIQEAVSASSSSFPVVSPAIRNWDRAYKMLTFLVLPAAFLAGQQVFQMIIGSW
jgi:hypothetical protein